MLHRCLDLARVQASRDSYYPLKVAKATLAKLALHTFRRVRFRLDRAATDRESVVGKRKRYVGLGQAWQLDEDDV